MGTYFFVFCQSVIQRKKEKFEKTTAYMHCLFLRVYFYQRRLWKWCTEWEKGFWKKNTIREYWAIRNKEVQCVKGRFLFFSYLHSIFIWKLKWEIFHYTYILENLKCYKAIFLTRSWIILIKDTLFLANTKWKQFHLRQKPALFCIDIENNKYFFNLTFWIL